MEEDLEGQENNIWIKIFSSTPFFKQHQDSPFFKQYSLNSTAFREYMLAGKPLLDYTNLFSPNDYRKNDNIIYKYFKDKYVKSCVYIKKN